MVQELFRRLKTEKLLLRNLSELQRSHAQLDDFNFVSVHHLQEPLRKLNIFSDRLQQKHQDDLPTEVQFLVQKLSEAAAEISDLIQDLTTYTTLGKAEEQQSFSEVSIANILQKVQKEHAEEIAQRSARIELAEGLPNVEGNPIQLHLLFTHLLSNSLKFARADEPLKIQLSASVVAGFEIPGVEDSDHDYSFYRINFIDNGIGIDKKYMHVIFELFQRLQKDKEVPGTGIGLAICKKIMLNHNGYIAVKSELNRGSTFSLFFPL
jgi:light-regulated signal transduction histidine kinase (bacteriophytochrome)